VNQLGVTTGCRRKVDKTLSAVALLAFCLVPVTPVCFAKESPPHNYSPASGYVPDAATAIKIAVAVWEPIYGSKTIASEAPYSATVAHGVWTVEGSMPRGIPGGTAIVEIDKVSGKVLRVSHGQ
jgi:hypothetical protein